MRMVVSTLDQYFAVLFNYTVRFHYFVFLVLFRIFRFSSVLHLDVLKIKKNRNSVDV